MGSMYMLRASVLSRFVHSTQSFCIFCQVRLQQGNGARYLLEHTRQHGVCRMREVGLWRTELQAMAGYGGGKCSVHAESSFLH